MHTMTFEAFTYQQKMKGIRACRKKVRLVLTHDEKQEYYSNLQNLELWQVVTNKQYTLGVNPNATFNKK